MTQHPLADALRDIINPLAKLRRDAEAKDREIGPMAYSIANDINFIQGIARDALAQYEKSDTDRDQLREAVQQAINDCRDADNEPMEELLQQVSAALASKTAIDPVTVGLPEYGDWLPDTWESYIWELAGEKPHGWANLPATFRWHEFRDRLDAAIRALGKDQ